MSFEKPNGRPPVHEIGEADRQRARIRCREIRKSRNWSQAEMGRRVGFYQTYICRLENGHDVPTTVVRAVLDLVGA